MKTKNINLAPNTTDNQGHGIDIAQTDKTGDYHKLERCDSSIYVPVASFMQLPHRQQQNSGTSGKTDENCTNTSFHTDPPRGSMVVPTAGSTQPKNTSDHLHIVNGDGTMQTRLVNGTSPTKPHLYIKPLSDASPYQAPPLPPRGAQTQIQSLLEPSVANFGPYKPVPPPKPLPETGTVNGAPSNFDQMVYNRQNDNRPQSGVIYQVSDSQIPSHMNHILLTEQGHFHTHSTKFPTEQQHNLNLNGNGQLTKKYDREQSLPTNGKSLTLDRNVPYPLIIEKDRMETDKTSTLPRTGSSQPTAATNHTNINTLKRREFNCNDSRPGQPLYRASGRFEGQIVDNSYRQTNGEYIGKSGGVYASMGSYEPVGQNNVPYNEHLVPRHPQSFRSQEPFQNNPVIQGNGFETHRQMMYDNGQRTQNHSIHQDQRASVSTQRQFQPQIERSGDYIAASNAQAIALSQLSIGQNQNGERNSIRNGSSQQVLNNGNSQQVPGIVDQEVKYEKNSSNKLVKKHSKLSNLISRFSKSDNKNSPSVKENGETKIIPVPPVNITSYVKDSKFQENNGHLKDKSLNASFRKAISYSTLTIPTDQNNEAQTIRDMRGNTDPRLHMSSMTVYNPEDIKLLDENRKTGFVRDRLPSDGRNTRTGSCGYLANQRSIGQTRSHWDLTNQTNNDQALPSDHAYPDLPMGGVKRGDTIRDSQVSGGSDSGRGTGSSEIRDGKSHDTSLESGQSSRHHGMQGQSSGNESEWIDITEPELQNLNAIMLRQKQNGAITPTLPPLSPDASPKVKSNSRSRPQSQSFNYSNEVRPDLIASTNKEKKNIQKPLQVNLAPRQSAPSTQRDTFQRSSSLMPSYAQEWPNKRHQVQNRQARNEKSPGKKHQVKANYKEQMNKFEKIEDDCISETIPDINSVIDGFTEFTTDDDDATSFGEGEAFLIRKQLDGLEGMYSEVLKLLGTRKTQFRRRMHGSMSSLPSSITSIRPSKDRKHRVVDDRIRKTGKDPSKNPHKRFQRLESHVVTLARSVAHLSSEMRTQQLMFQEMEAIRTELGSLRAATVGNVGVKYTQNGVVHPTNLWDNLKHSNNAGLSNPGRVKKLTQFFGDEPPLVRLFLKKLGYEKYADLFEQQRIGMLELPYLTEERLQKIGIPLGPRIRIIQEAQGPIKCEGNLSVYVV